MATVHYDFSDEDAALARRMQEEEINAAAHALSPEERQRLVESLGGADNAVAQNMAQDLEDAQEQSPRLLTIYLTYVFIELVATSYFLDHSWSDACDKPLRWFILVYALRFLFLVPVTIYRFKRARAGHDTTNAREFTRYVQFATLGWWVMGQIWLYSSSTCKATSPNLFWYSVVLVILVYVAWLLPLILLLGLFICFPCVLLILRLISEEKGASDAVIQELPTRTFEADNSGAPLLDDQASDDQPSCSICRSEYEVGDSLRCLPCNHEFHKDCVDQWLKIKRECPLCRGDITAPRGQPSADEEKDALDQV